MSPTRKWTSSVVMISWWVGWAGQVILVYHYAFFHTRALRKWYWVWDGDRVIGFGGYRGWGLWVESIGCRWFVNRERRTTTSFVLGKQSWGLAADAFANGRILLVYAVRKGIVTIVNRAIEVITEIAWLHFCNHWNHLTTFFVTKFLIIEIMGLVFEWNLLSKESL